MDMEEDAEILATLLEHIPSCMSAPDIEQLLQDIPVQPPVVVPVRTVQEAIAAGDLPPLVEACGASLARVSVSQIPSDCPLASFKTGSVDRRELWSGLQES